MKKIRHIARIILEAETPLFVGSGQSSLLKDALVQKDINGLPMILGTSIAGVLRHQFDEKTGNNIFGDDKPNGNASLLKVSSAYLMINESKVSEGIIDENEILNHFENLPSRQHVRITDKGVADTDKSGLFDNEIVHKGLRFMFEIEFLSSENEDKNWKELLMKIQSPTFRLGSGTRNGYGKLKVYKIFNQTYDLTKKEDFEDYLNFNPSFNSNLKFEEPEIDLNISSNNFIHFQLKLQPDSFFIFSEGYGDDQVDNKPLEEIVAEYKDQGINFETKQTVLPASSIKGAIAHRVAFHYNKLMKNYSDNQAGQIGTDNYAVNELFGVAGKDVSDPKAGNVFIDDIFLTKDQVNNNKIFNHVAIDRFTGGAMEGALFSEKVSSLQEKELIINIFVKNITFEKTEVLESLRNALKDIAKGLLPLGGMTTKGNGMFTGIVIEKGEEIFNYLTGFEKK